jgi:cytochrome c peroxidase
MISRTVLLLGVTAAASLFGIGHAAGSDRSEPSDALFRAAADLSLQALEPLPPDASNRWADDERAADLGHQLFFDTRLSANGRVSCASCHDPKRQFQDSRPLAQGVGTTSRRTMPIAAGAYSPFLFWDGRKDSQWAQALGPLESPVEHGGTRASYAHVVAKYYRADYERIFGTLPDLHEVPPEAGPVADQKLRTAWQQLTSGTRDSVTEMFVNVGKAIAAYERRIQYGPSRFDRFVSTWKANGTQPKDVLTADEIAGLRLFVGKANCVQCHNGPLLTNNGFHNTGVPRRPGLADDSGRIAAIVTVMDDEFNCRSRWSDAGARGCPELNALTAPGTEHNRAFKVPSLRNVAERAPYMHAGQFSTLSEVLKHYNRAPTAPLGRTEIKPLGLSATELRRLETFLHSLSGGLAGPEKYLRAPRSSIAHTAP